MTREADIHKEASKPRSDVYVLGGSGQVGRLFQETLLNPGYSVLPVGRDDIHLLDGLSSATLIFAVPRTADELMHRVGGLDITRSTILLPQNGVGLAGIAQEAFRDQDAAIVRASLLTAVEAYDGSSTLQYNPNKLRIALSLVSGETSSLTSAAELFERSGYKSQIIEDTVSMEWTKLLLNTVGSTSSITGLTPEETFEDPYLAAMEIHGLKERLAVIGRSPDIRLARLMGAPPLDVISTILSMSPERLLVELRGPIGQFVSKGRNNKVAGSFRRLQEGKPTEIPFYHEPFIQRAEAVGLSSDVDRAIMATYQDHMEGRIDLRTLSPLRRAYYLLSKLA